MILLTFRNRFQHCMKASLGLFWNAYFPAWFFKLLWLDWTNIPPECQFVLQQKNSLNKNQPLTSQPITLIILQMCFSLKDLPPWTAAGPWEGKKRDRTGETERAREEERLDLFEQSGCNESSPGLNGGREVEWVGKSEEEGGNGVKSNMQTDCWTW